MRVIDFMCAGCYWIPWSARCRRPPIALRFRLARGQRAYFAYTKYGRNLLFRRCFMISQQFYYYFGGFTLHLFSIFVYIGVGAVLHVDLWLHTEMSFCGIKMNLNQIKWWLRHWLSFGNWTVCAQWVWWRCSWQRSQRCAFVSFISPAQPMKFDSKFSRIHVCFCE